MGPIGRCQIGNTAGARKFSFVCKYRNLRTLGFVVMQIISITAEIRNLRNCLIVQIDLDQLVFTRLTSFIIISINISLSF